MGEPVQVVVDDRLPYRMETTPGYYETGVKFPTNSGMSENGAWWLPILEKAYAKFNVNYS